MSAAIDTLATEPPPSAYDLQQRAGGESSDQGGRSFTGQLWRTLLSLLLVVALIYGLGRLALWRLGRPRNQGGTAGLRVVNRLQLDARHALFVVEVSGKQRFLLAAGGDKGVTLISTLEAGSTSAPSSSSSGSTGSFSDVLAKTGAAGQSADTSGSEGSS